MPVREQWGALVPESSPLARKDAPTPEDLAGLPLVTTGAATSHRAPSAAGWAGTRAASMSWQPATCSTTRRCWPEAAAAPPSAPALTAGMTACASSRWPRHSKPAQRWPGKRSSRCPPPPRPSSPSLRNTLQAYHRIRYKHWTFYGPCAMIRVSRMGTPLFFRTKRTSHDQRRSH